MPAKLLRPPLSIVVPLGAALVVLLGVFFYFYRGGYSPPPAVDIPFDQLTRTTSVTEADDFVDVPGLQIRPGLLLVDSSHRNAFNQDEMVTLLSRVNARGYDVQFTGDFTREEPADRTPLLEERLREADSYLVILPREPFVDAEIDLLRRFIEKGGKLLLIADPTRPHDINSLGGPLGLEFQADYLFNQTEYDLNFQHIFVRDFQPGDLTSGLDEVVFYTAGSIKTSGSGLAHTDANTESSLAGQDGPMHPIATGEHRNVLGIFDMTFLIPPQNSVADNNQLVSNVADFLTNGERGFELADFPSFFKDEVDIILGQPDLIDRGTTTRSLLADMQIRSELHELEDLASDTVFLGLFEDSTQVLQHLESNGIQVDDTLSIASASEIPLEGTSIIALTRSQDRHVLVVLADTTETLKDAIDRLGSGDFRSGLVDDFVGVYRTE